MPPKELLTDKLKVYTVFHKQSYIPSAKYLHPIHAGKAVSSLNLEMDTDDDGENISAINPKMCELTVLYNVWKNKKYLPASYWGLCHYRRYFTLNIHWTGIKKKTVYFFDEVQKNYEKVFTQNLENFLSKQLSPATVILPEPQKLKHDNNKFLSVKDQYSKDHDVAGWQLMETAIEKLHPGYLDSFAATGNGNLLSAFNMMIAHHTVWDKYLSWLFEIIFYINENATFSEDAYQSRTIGFMSERLMNVYFHYHKNNYAIVYLPVATFLNK